METKHIAPIMSTIKIVGSGPQWNPGKTAAKVNATVVQQIMLMSSGQMTARASGVCKEVSIFILVLHCCPIFHGINFDILD